MIIATRRARQTLIGILAVLSLCVSSVAACACSHHGQTSQPKKLSCHSEPAAEITHDPDESDRPPGSSFDETCFCIQPSVKLSVKAEAFKYKKQASDASTGFELAPKYFHSSRPVLHRDRLSAIRVNTFSTSGSSRGPPSS